MNKGTDSLSYSSETPENISKPFKITEAVLTAGGARNFMQPTKAELPMQPTETKLSMQPIETKHSMQPIEAKHSMQPTEAELFMYPTEAKQSMQPTEVEQSMQPKEAKLSMQPNGAALSMQLSNGDDYRQPDNDGTEESNEQNGPSSKFLYVTGVFYCLCFTLCDTAAKTFSQLLNGSVPSLQMNIGQFTFLIAIMTPHMVIKGKIRPTSTLGFIIALIIGMLKCLNYFCCNLAVLYMPVGTATTEMNAVFLLTILAWTAVCTHDSTRQILFIDACVVVLIIIGVVLVTQPPVLFHSVETPNVTLVTICNKELNAHNESCYFAPEVDSPNIIGFNDGEIRAPGRLDVERPEWVGHLLIVIFGASSTACLVLLSKGAKYLGTAEIIYWSSISADVLSIMSFAIYRQGAIVIPHKKLCFIIWVIHAICGGATGIFGNVAVIRLPPTDFGVISSLSIVNLFVLQFTLLERIKPTYLNAASLIGAIIICVTTFGKPILRNLCQSNSDSNPDQISEATGLLSDQSDK